MKDEVTVYGTVISTKLAAHVDRCTSEEGCACNLPTPSPYRLHDIFSHCVLFLDDASAYRSPAATARTIGEDAAGVILQATLSNRPGESGHDDVPRLRVRG